MKIYIDKLFIAITIFLMMMGCDGDKKDSFNNYSDDYFNTDSYELSGWLSDNLDKQVIYSTIANSKFVIIINLTTNRSIMVSNGIVVDGWNSISGDITGAYHIVDGKPKSYVTPPGIYKVHDIEQCPAWLPYKPPGFVYHSENEEYDESDYHKARMEFIKADPDKFGPCGINNPLGNYAFWFWGEYGYHGTRDKDEWLLDLQKPHERYLSHGCVRNPNHKIRSLFNHILKHIDDDGFIKATKENMKKSIKDRKTITKDISDQLDIKIIIGHFKKDLPFTIYDDHLDTIKMTKKTKCTITGGNALVFDKKDMSGEPSGHFINDSSIDVFNIKYDSQEPIKTYHGWIDSLHTDHTQTCKDSYHWFKYRLDL